MNRQATIQLLALYCRRVAASFVAVTIVALGQAVVHEHTYRPLPEIDSRKFGLELPNELARRFKQKQKEMAEKKREVVGKAERLVDRWKRMWASSIWREQPLQIVDVVHPPSRDDRPRFRVLFIGDSLVNGVGGAQSEATEGGPPLPRRMCRALADKLGVQVQWRALGVTGGDLEAMRNKLVPEIREKDPNAVYDAVVVMCGLNDFKYLARGQIRTPWAFREQLQALVSEIRRECGDNTRIVLPALPVGLASFREPLKSYIIFIANQWDLQKQLVAKKSREILHHQHILFVEPVSPSETDASHSFVAADGVHPNESGYELWAQHIASRLCSAHD